MTELTFLRDLAVVMAAGGLTTVVFHLLRQPVVLGYLVAGIVIGPHTPPFSLVSDLHSIHTLAELGIVLLLFTLGLEFDLKKLRRVGAVAVLAAVLKVLFMLWLGYAVGQLLGWEQMDSLFLGAVLSISSTTIIVRVLEESGQMRELFAQIILGILIVEDVAAILILVVLSGLAGAGTVTVGELGWALLRVMLFMATALVVGLALVPRLLSFVNAFQRSEMLTITVLGLAFGLAVLGAQFGFSVALGAFLMGAIMAESQEAHQIVEQIGPIREMFTAIFFVATGMLLDPSLMATLWVTVLLIVALTVIGKVVSCSFGVFLAGYPGRVALPAGLSMAPIGEFSFIIANLGRTSGVTSSALYPLAVAVSAVTTLMTPYLLRSAPILGRTLTRLSPRPLLTFTTFYSAWMARLTARTPRTERVIPGLFLRFLLYLAVTVTLFVVTWSGVRPLVRTLPEIVPRQSVVLPWAIAGIVTLPFLFLVSRTVENLIHQTTAALLRSPRERTTGNSRLIRSTLYFLLGWVASVFVLAVWSPLLPPLVPLVVVGGGLLVTTYFFWGSLMRFHEHIDDVLNTLSGSPTPTTVTASPAENGQRTEVTRLLSDRYGIAVQTVDFIVPLYSTALNQSIRGLRLRQLTGASIIAIYRDPEQIIIPQADTVLLPGDVLVLLGEQEQLEAAVGFLIETAKQKKDEPVSSPHIASVLIVDGSPFAHQTLAALGLREDLGVLIVGAQRGERQITNPGPDFLVQPDDVLYLWGIPERVEEAQHRATGGRGDRDRNERATPTT